MNPNPGVNPNRVEQTDETNRDTPHSRYMAWLVEAVDGVGC